ncbi:uncharacterized protein K02A2.6-like [Capsicum annuum]|uniref:uncharacterized protein K02A2.6-like n=1 Tax=Capsicum annuum TaxID=4072 RepID=UPI001FB0659F|nr:uncharacterized protein K02A2.6-like [Capsicum annuum]
MNGFAFVIKIMRTGYFWMTMENNCSKYVQKRPKCQMDRDLIQIPPHELYVMSLPWSFIAWGIDVIGPIEPPASNGHRYILFAIDYFIKWVKVISYRAVTKKMVEDFVKNLICQFGVLESIITDNGANFNCHLMNEICDQFKIAHRNSTTYRPQMNGAMEAANKNIKKVLRKMVKNDISWHEMLPYALLGYRTIVRTSTGVTPYLFVYGNEVVIPSKRMDAVCHSQLYQHRMIRAFNKKLRARTFEVGQFFLKCIFTHQEEYKSKFVPN